MRCLVYNRSAKLLHMIFHESKDLQSFSFHLTFAGGTMYEYFLESSSTEAKSARSLPTCVHSDVENLFQLSKPNLQLIRLCCSTRQKCGQSCLEKSKSVLLGPSSILCTPLWGTSASVNHWKGCLHCHLFFKTVFKKLPEIQRQEVCQRDKGSRCFYAKMPQTHQQDCEEPW